MKDFNHLFENDASFLGFMDDMGELDDKQKNEEIEITFTFEFDDTCDSDGSGNSCSDKGNKKTAKKH